MAYDRHDERSGWRDERPRWPDDERERGRRERGEDRGFFERAGDQIASWFGDDDDPRRDQRDQRGERGEWRPRERGFSERGGDEREWRGGRERWREEEHGERGGYRPVTGDYGRSGRFEGRDDDHQRSDRSNWDRDEYRRTSFAGSQARSSDGDDHYRECRRRHIEEFDREYDEFRRQNRASFERDFGNWREQRQSKRQLLGQVREHMDVAGSDGEHVGKVDRVAGDRIILAKSDSDSGGAHSLSCTDLDRIEDDRLILDCTADQARKRWRDDSRERALFEREDQGSSGPHMLDRSFSGTYR